MASAYGAGAALGGAVTGLAIWLLSGFVSWVDPRWAAGAVCAAAALTVLRDLGAVRFALPQNARLVPFSVVQRRPGAAAFQFGFEMGTGVRTFVTSSSPYLLAVCVLLLVDHPLGALIVGALFGAGRFAMFLLRYSSDAGDEWDRLMAGRAQTLVRSSALVSAFAAVWLAVGIHG